MLGRRTLSEFTLRGPVSTGGYVKLAHAGAVEEKNLHGGAALAVVTDALERGTREPIERPTEVTGFGAAPGPLCGEHVRDVSVRRWTT